MAWSPMSGMAKSFMRNVALRPGATDRMPFPIDEPRIHVAGRDPDRVLFFGGGIVSGLGATTYRSSVIGHSARQISALTARGVDIDAVPDLGVTVRGAVGAIGRIPLARYDAIVIDCGLNDVFLRTSIRAWDAGVWALMDAIDAVRSASCSVYLVGISDPTKSPIYRSALVALAAQRVKAFNRVTRRIAAERDGVSFLEFEAGPPESEEHVYTTASHARWASQLVGPIADGLNDSFARGLTGVGYGEFAEPDRQRAVDALQIVDTEPEERFDRIVKIAKSMFRTESATFAVIDRDRAWLKSSVGVHLAQIERTVSFCNSTIGERNGLEIVDASADPRFQDNPLVTGEPAVRFYLGHPVESREGYPVGVLCVFDPSPREHDPDGISKLRELAVLLGRELDR